MKAKAPAPLRVRVTCPADGYAGKPIVVQIPDGRKARAAIPDVDPGETFTILVPASPPVHRVSVTCPPNKPPGSQLLVRVPSSGQTIRATVPQRLGPGRSFIDTCTYNGDQVADGAQIGNAGERCEIPTGEPTAGPTAAGRR